MQAMHFQMSIAGWGGSPLGYVTLAQLESSQTPRVNASRFAMEEYDRVYTQMLREPDVQKQVALSRRMSEIAQAYAPLIPHVAEVDNAFVQPWLQGFEPNDFTSYFKYLDIDVAAQQRAQLARSRAKR
jgi:ABC-type oligopeptide transport system substrate-binding subunit